MNTFGSTMLVTVAVVGYFAILPAMVVAFWLMEEDRLDEADYTWRRVYWVGAVVSLTAMVLIMYMP